MSSSRVVHSPCCVSLLCLIVISSAVGRHRCDRMYSSYIRCIGLYELIYSVISFYFFLFCVRCPASSSRWIGEGGRYRLYLILFLSLVACSWVIECNNRGVLFNKCTIFSCWTVGCWCNELNWTTTLCVFLFVFFALYQQGRKKDINFQYISQLRLVCLLNNFQLSWDCYFCCCCLLPELDEIFPRTRSCIQCKQLYLVISPCALRNPDIFCVSVFSLFSHESFCFWCLFYDSFSLFFTTITPLRGLSNRLVHCKHTYGSSRRLGH